MKKTYHFLFSCILAVMIGILPILTFAQEEGDQVELTRKEKRQDFNKYFYLNGNIGMYWNHTDISLNRYFPPTNSWRLGYGGAFGWQFKPIWGLRVKASGGKLYGEVENPWWAVHAVPGDPFAPKVPYEKLYFETTKMFDYHLDLTINFSNLISGYKEDRFVDVYGILGVGQSQWHSNTYDGITDTLIRADGAGLTPGSGQGFDGRYMVLNLTTGLGAEFRLSPKFDATLEWEFKILDTDLLDNFVKGGQAIRRDMYSYPSIGLTYKFGGSDPLKKMKKNYETVTFKAEPDPLEAHGGKIPVKITGTFPEGYFHPKAAMYIEPYLVCDGMNVPMKPILLKGTSVGGEGIVISKDGGSFTYETVIDYNESCQVAELYVEPIAFIPKGDLPADLTKESVLDYKKYVELPAKKIADGTIVTPERFAFNQTGSIVPHGYVKENILSKDSRIYFEVNKHNLNWNVPLNKVEANKTSLSQIFEYLSLGYQVKDINIDGWASPEGEETFNQGLSENRAKTANGYVVDKIKAMIKAKESKLTIKDAAKDINYNLVHHGPDWNGFITSLQNSDISDKNTILNVINSAGTPAQKEQEIRNMILIYPEIEAKLLAPLRRAEIVVNCYEPKKTDEEIAALSTSNPGALDEKELLYSATLQQDKKVKLDIYKSAIELFPNSYKGYANAGAIELEMGDVSAAKAHLEKAASLNANSGEVHNNLGIIYALEGNYTKAEEHFTKAGQLGTDASYNLGILSIHKGDYTKALSQFGNKSCDYNVALAYIASKNYPPAEKQLQCAPKDAQTHYLMAILGSRTANTAMLFENLGKAIQMNAAYKEEAKIDREFIKYFEDPSFVSIVK